ncbi:GNAT family N-acetyltransferase [Marinicella meishanensis]|uniref:GNAT family N-acetyltransferase n=1 Tax=Marinicella meishanensis TaxID=2873263 RepID=UPI001CBA969A|nr:GNAT family N-acetyltransferase [Marinicella sp. NBU2979]
MIIRKADIQDLPQLSQLFDGYRRFYQQPGDLPGAEAFIRERLTQQESVVLVAEDQDQLLGFTQLFPSFSSVSMQRLWILNDLFVAEPARGAGVAAALMNHAKELAADTKGIILETDWDNVKAQKLYDKLGYQKQDSTYHYFLPIGGAG